ncbi:cupin domain-containing protein [Candidatus Leptofilum sp.]|uniref:cupin domain-containing protein n=1 Tax=Candidatus Leptofilum sp. TaxID=3241576 RepID=UPI003B594AE8
MTKIITGRTIDQHGNFVDGTGFEFETDSHIAELLDQRISPLFSQPITGEFIFVLVSSADSGGEFERGVGIFPPGNAGPPEHIHPTYDEIFDIVQGDFIFVVDGKEQKAGTGEQVIVPKGMPHTFRCVGAQNGVIVAETRPAARTSSVIATLFGSAHEGRLTPAGQPKFWHAMLIGSEYADDTVFTSPPPSITRPLAKALAPIGRLLGYRAVDPKYLEEAFWRTHVEQPVLNQVRNGLNAPQIA